MSQYALEVEDWTIWKRVREFSSPSMARRHGLTKYAQNNWRILDRQTGEYVATHNGFDTIQSEAEQEQARLNFNWPAELARRQAEAEAQEERRRQQRERRRTIQLLEIERGIRFRNAVFGDYEIVDRVNWRQEGF